MRFETIARSATPIQSQVQPQPQAQQPQMSPDDYVTAAQLNQWGQEAARAVAAPAMEANAQLAWRMVQQEHPEIFQRYAPEALELWAKLPVHQRTLEGAQMVVKLVKGEHARELAQVYASGGSGEPSLGRSGGGPAPNAANGGAPNSGRVSILDDERIPLEWRQKAKERGITDEVVDEFTRAYPGMTREDYIKKYLIRSAGG